MTVWIFPNLLCSISSFWIHYGAQSSILVKFMFVWNFSRLLPSSISSVSKYYGLESDIWVKSYDHLNFPKDSLLNFERCDIWRASIEHSSENLWGLNLARATLFNFENLDILLASIEHPNQNLWQIEFSQGFHSQFWALGYILGLNWTFQSKVIAIWIFPRLPCSILSVLIYYGSQ